MATIRPRTFGAFSPSTCGLVAMTSAQHAEGRQFDPGQVYVWWPLLVDTGVALAGGANLVFSVSHPYVGKQTLPNFAKGLVGPPTTPRLPYPPPPRGGGGMGGRGVAPPPRPHPRPNLLFRCDPEIPANLRKCLGRFLVFLCVCAWASAFPAAMQQSDTEGIRTPAGRAQWISSPSP